MPSYLKKINRSSVVQSIIDNLTEAMINGDLKPGDQIPTEIELSEEFGVARNSVREAVKILVYLGVLEIRRSDGTYVCEGFTDNLMDPMIYGMILNQQNTQELNELRAMIESGVLRLAVQKCSDEEIEKLAERLSDLEKALTDEQPDYKKVFDYDNAFHDTITSMGHNALIKKINNMVLQLTHTIRFDTVKRMVETGRCDELLAAHKRVYDLVSNRQEKDLYSSVKDTYFIEDEPIDKI